MSTATGHCLCGAVVYRTSGAPHMHVCHCSNCTRWSGGPFIGMRFDGGVEIGNPDGVNWYASSEWAERGSCKACGGALFYRFRQDPSQVIVAAGSLDSAPETAIGEHIFIDEKPAYYDFAGDAPRLTGAEVFARFQSSQESGS
jgi:hypothetical protein